MSKTQSSFVKQAAILAIAGLLVRFIGFVYRLPLTNMIGNEGNGIYGAGYLLYMFFLIMSSAGLPVAIAKMVSTRSALRQYENAHLVFRVSLIVAASLGLLCSLILGLGADALVSLFNIDKRSTLAIITLSPTVLIVAVMAVFRGYFQGMNNTVPTALSQIVEQVFNAVFSVLLCYIFMGQAKDITKGAAGGTAGTGVGALAGLLTLLAIYVLYRPTLQKRLADNDIYTPPENKIAIGRELLITAVPIIIGTAIFSISNIIDVAMVRSLLLGSGHSEEEATALYGMLNGKYITLSTLPVSISSSLATVVVPNIAGTIAKGDKRAANQKINEALRLTMLITAPAAIGIGVLADPILLLLFPQVPDGGYLLKWGAASIFFLALYQIITGMLQGSGYMHVPVIAAFCGAIVKVPLNYLFIPIKSFSLFGLTIPVNVAGAVISTIGCYVVASLINLFMLKRIMGRRAKLDLTRGFLKPLVASVIMGFCSYTTYALLFMASGSNTFACLAAICVGVVTYFGYMILIKGVDQRDLRLLRRKKV